jgi:hypothetical protein
MIWLTLYLYLCVILLSLTVVRTFRLKVFWRDMVEAVLFPIRFPFVLVKTIINKRR